MTLNTGDQETLKIIGWEAGTRTPIARFRVWSPTIGRPPSKRESEFTNHARGCQLNPQKLMLELPCIQDAQWALRQSRWRRTPVTKTKTIAFIFSFSGDMTESR